MGSISDVWDRLFEHSKMKRRRLAEAKPQRARILVNWNRDEEIARQIASIPKHYADSIYYVDRRAPFGIADYGNISLTTTQKCLWTPGATNPCILPANYWITLGKTQRLTTNLKWTAVANTNTITVGMQYGAADAAAANVVASAATPVSSTTVFNVFAQGVATCRLLGTSGTLSMWGCSAGRCG